MEYKPSIIETKWQEYWKKNKIFRAETKPEAPKFYVLDMFPYPSGAGLHVGHPLGYIASDIYARYKRLMGFNVLHPMGFDAYGLPAEQYAIQTGTHPAETTAKNISIYRRQLDQLGFSFDWDREVQTSDPDYYKWTQWTFIQLFESWYNNKNQKAEPLNTLIQEFNKNGNIKVDADCLENPEFTADQWAQFSEEEIQETLMNYRLAYLSDTWVNWCPELGTVLANDEVKDGFSERGGHPVERKLMKQWSLRITAYAQRLLDGLDTIDWTDSLKEMQKNWIGRSEGAGVQFSIDGHDDKIDVFTTRPDTLFGATYMVLAPEHELVEKITSKECSIDVEEYIYNSKNRSERDRIAEVKKITGVFTGSYGINPLNNKKIPVWIADYVLTGYGTGAIMAVPGHDSRDFAFAKHFSLPVIQVVVGKNDSPSDPASWEDSYDSKEGNMINSGFMNGLEVSEAISIAIQKLEEMNIGKGKINFRLRDAIFSRQRYWGEPFPIYYKNGMPYAMKEEELPLKLPPVDKYLPTETGDPPLARARNWKTKDGYPIETNTMPGFAGSSGYYLRYMDPQNEQEYFSKKDNEYWRNVDLYIGGDEHATGHLIYSRFWNKFLFDIGIACEEEPFKKLINQGKIQGRSSFVYRITGTNKFVSAGLKKNHNTTALHVDINLVQNDNLDIDGFRNWRAEFKNAEFILEDGKYLCGWEVEKMSKSKHNVQNPDALIEKYGADTLRLYEMFLGPLEQSKPWDTNGIEGVSRFLKKFWRLFIAEDGSLKLKNETPSEEENKILNRTVDKVRGDIERFSFNTAISSFMICINELTDLKSSNLQIFEKLLISISPFAPHISEELWSKMGNKSSISQASFPEIEERYLKDDTMEYPVSFNGKMRFKLEFPVNQDKKSIEEAVLKEEKAKKWLEGKEIVKVIVVPGKIVNIVVR